LMCWRRTNQSLAALPPTGTHKSARRTLRNAEDRAKRGLITHKMSVETLTQNTTLLGGLVRYRFFSPGRTTACKNWSRGRAVLVDFATAGRKHRATDNRLWRRWPTGTLGGVLRTGSPASSFDLNRRLGSLEPCGGQMAHRALRRRMRSRRPCRTSGRSDWRRALFESWPAPVTAVPPRRNESAVAAARLLILKLCRSAVVAAASAPQRNSHAPRAHFKI
jgi:hypothetical protein